MATAYHPFKIALTHSQKQRLQEAFARKFVVTLRVKLNKSVMEKNSF